MSSRNKEAVWILWPRFSPFLPDKANALHNYVVLCNPGRTGWEEIKFTGLGYFRRTNSRLVNYLKLNRYKNRDLKSRPVILGYPSHNCLE